MILATRIKTQYIKIGLHLELLWHFVLEVKLSSKSQHFVKYAWKTSPNFKETQNVTLDKAAGSLSFEVKYSYVKTYDCTVSTNANDYSDCKQPL
jgi:hypothetical protein